MHAVVYSCLVDFVKSELGSFTHEIFSVDSHIHRDKYFSVRSMLCTMCRVSSEWRYLAQRALQMRIVLRSRRGVRSFEKNCQFGPWIRELYLEPVIIKPFEEEYDISSESDSEPSSDTSSDEYNSVSTDSGYDTIEMQEKNNTRYLAILVYLSERLIPKLSNLRCLGISMRHYHPEIDLNGCILDFIDSLQYVPRLQGLFLIDPNTHCKSDTEPFLVPLFHRVAQLPSLSHLWISNFGTTDSAADEELPSALMHIKPPPLLKFVGFEAPGARLPHAVQSWLVATRDNCIPECVVASIPGNSENNDLLRVLSNPCAITRLHLDFASFGCYQSTIDAVSSVLPSLTSLRELHIGYGLVVKLRVFLPTLCKLRLEFLYPDHFERHSDGGRHESICDIVSLGYLPNLKKVTFSVLFDTETADFNNIDDILRPDEYPLTIALRDQFGIECDFNSTEISAQRRLLADSFGCPS